MILDRSKTSTLGIAKPVQFIKIDLKYRHSSLIYSTCNDHQTYMSFKTEVKHLCQHTKE